MKRLVGVFALLVILGSAVNAQEVDGVFPPGPPPEVIAAWESGVGNLLPGPPEWVIAMRSEGGKVPDAMPAWVAAMHDRAAEIGLPGPPPEVIEAWEHGEGDLLPGPPPFVLDMLRMFGRGV